MGDAGADRGIDTITPVSPLDPLIAQTAQTAQVIATQGQQTGAAIATMADAVLAAAANMGTAVQTMNKPRSITLERGKHGELTGASVVPDAEETPYN